MPWSHIHKQEMYAWLYWSIFNAHLPPHDCIPASHQKVLHDALEMIEKRSGMTIPDGSNPAAVPLLLTLDPVNIAWRPFGWYVLIALGNVVMKHWFIARWDMRRGVRDGVEYLVRVPRGWNPQAGPAPVVFVHGLGLGLLQYRPIIGHLLHQLPDSPLLIPLQPHISQSLFHPHFLAPKGRRETAWVLREVLVELGWIKDQEAQEVEGLVGPAEEKSRGVTMLSHSNGSYTHAWMLKAHPELITRSAFVDPVTFCSWEGGTSLLYPPLTHRDRELISIGTDVCYNFIYKRCTNVRIPFPMILDKKS